MSAKCNVKKIKPEQQSKAIATTKNKQQNVVSKKPVRKNRKTDKNQKVTDRKQYIDIEMDDFGGDWSIDSDIF